MIGSRFADDMLQVLRDNIDFYPVLKIERHENDHDIVGSQIVQIATERALTGQDGSSEQARAYLRNVKDVWIDRDTFTLLCWSGAHPLTSIALAHAHPVGLWNKDTATCFWTFRGDDGEISLIPDNATGRDRMEILYRIGLASWQSDERTLSIPKGLQLPISVEANIQGMPLARLVEAPSLDRLNLTIERIEGNEIHFEQGPDLIELRHLPEIYDAAVAAGQVGAIRGTSLSRQSEIYQRIRACVDVAFDRAYGIQAAAAAISVEIPRPLPAGHYELPPEPEHCVPALIEGPAHPNG